MFIKENTVNNAPSVGLKKKKPKTQEQKMQTPKHQIQTKLIFPSRENQKTLLYYVCVWIQLILLKTEN